jgi:NAD(P)-dependent dehydrogenase (short-subunit alcohol dehydrogenase family)
MKYDFSGKSILVTGSNRGIGRELVHELAKRNVKRIYAAARNIDTLKDLQAIYADILIPIELDVIDALSLKNATEQIIELDMLINNASSVNSRSVMTASLEELVQDFTLNSVSPLFVSRAFLPQLLKSATPAIANTLSTVAISNSPGLGGYSMSKAAEYAMSQSLSSELQAQGVTVYYIFPGLTATELTDDLPGSKATPEEVAKNALDDITKGEQYIFPAPNAKAIELKWMTNPKNSAR